ncbi:MAG: hypothetical protein IE933_09915 [Sphingomonadales bacterium]|nr:hypothetical protein [Sphingomonadales bacterium]MBD3774050.1 hypothetical protein [Paracoccaceae bacterium]
MNRLIAASLLALAPAASLGLAVPASAQDDAGDKVNMVVIYGDDSCPPSTEGEITVCARLDESERFRIPETLRDSSSPDTVAWAERAKSFETVGSYGALSCSPTGAGGFTGCTQALVDAAYGEKKEAPGVRFSQLIDKAREERLSTIDQEAAEEQARVEVIEKQYEAKLEAERAAPLPGEDGAATDTGAQGDEALPPITPKN